MRRRMDIFAGEAAAKVLQSFSSPFSHLSLNEVLSSQSKTEGEKTTEH